MSMGTVSITIEAVDKASEEIKRVGESVGRLKSAASGAAQSSVDLKKALRDVGSSSVALATSAFALYMAYDRVQDRMLSYQQALVTVHTLQIRLARAQEQYRTAVERYGADSTQAAIAAENLTKAQEALRVAQRRAQQYQQDINNEMMRTALLAIPASISALKNLRDLVAGLKTAFSGLTGTAAALGSGLLAMGKWGAIAAAAFLFGYKAAEWWETTGKKFTMTQSEALEAIEYASIGMNYWAMRSEEAANAAREVGDASADVAGEIIRVFYSSQQTAKAVEELQSRYRSGSISMRDFVQGLLDLGLAQDEILEKLRKLGDTSTQTIQQKLVNQAQGLIEEFRQCSSGKFAQIGQMGAEQMQALVENTNQLIRQGLVGQAQANIQAFADCAAGKQYRLAYDIAQITKSMTDRVNREYQAMVNWANTLSGEQKAMALKNAEAWKQEQLNVIESLKQLQSAALADMGADIASTIASSVQQATSNLGDLNAMIEAIPPQTTATVNVVVTGREELASLKSELESLPTGITVPIHIGTGGGGAFGGYPGPYYLQKGGLVTRPTLAVLGERGPEAVIPLDRAGPLTQNVHNVFYVNTSNQVEFDLFLREFERRMVAAWRKAREYA